MFIDSHVFGVKTFFNSLLLGIFFLFPLVNQSEKHVSQGIHV